MQESTPTLADEKPKKNTLKTILIIIGFIIAIAAGFFAGRYVADLEDKVDDYIVNKGDTNKKPDESKNNENPVSPLDEDNHPSESEMTKDYNNYIMKMERLLILQEH